MTEREAIEAVKRAWLVEGPAPEFHRRWKNRLRSEWPSLADAVEALVRASDTPRENVANRLES